MPLPPSRRVAVLAPPPSFTHKSPTFKFRVTPGTSFAQDAEYIVGHVQMGRPVDGPFVLWVVETLAKHRDAEADEVEELRDELKGAEDEAVTAVNELEDKVREFDKEVDRADRLSKAVADFLAGKIKKADLEKAQDDYTNGD